MRGKRSSVLTALLHIFKHHADESIYAAQVNSSLKSDLQAAGFAEKVVDAALQWLVDLVVWEDYRHILSPSQPGTFRVFNDYEKSFFDEQCRYYIMQLEYNGVLNALSREMVIDRVMALAEEGVDIPLIKWVTLLVLFNHPNEEQAKPLIELLALEVASDTVN